MDRYITVNMKHGDTVPPRVKVSQYEKGWPLHISLVYEGSPWVVPSTATIYIQGTKKDYRGFVYQLRTGAGSSTITFTLTDQVTAFAGDVATEVVVMDEDNEVRIGSANFIIEVEPAALKDDVIISETDLPVIGRLPEIVNQLDAALNQATTAATNAEASASQASMSADSAADSAFQAAQSEQHTVEVATNSIDQMTTMVREADTLIGGYAASAAQSAENARQSELNAKDSEIASRSSENSAATNAGTAEQSADEAVESASAAAASQEAAAASEIAAEGYAAAMQEAVDNMELAPKGEWDSETTYYPLNLVKVTISSELEGVEDVVSLYIATAVSTNQEPLPRQSSAYWNYLFSSTLNDIVVDDAFSFVSNNPVQNRIITTALDTMNDDIEAATTLSTNAYNTAVAAEAAVANKANLGQIPVDPVDTTGMNIWIVTA